MKYMVISMFEDNVTVEAMMTAWGNEKPQAGVERLNAWHVGVGTGKSFNLFEVDNLYSLSDFLTQYQDLLNIESYVLADDAEMKRHYSV